ncbi:MAG: hypothetical protein RR576_02825 [Oscillospiraceae bacterium]
MQNRKYYPFERNSYYSGKLLTARDFEAEQRYFNDKRRFLNRLEGAGGIASGLGVIMADDASVILQAGCAMDASGREIVVAETQVIKLSTIEGFGELTTQSAFLGISYDEQAVDEVYSVMNDDTGGEHYNKMREQYKLTLLDENLVAHIETPTEEMVAKLVIYADNDVEVAQYTPRFLPKGSELMVRVQITRFAQGSGEYSFAYTMDTPGLCGEQNKQSTEVAVNNLKLLQGECSNYDYTLCPEPYTYGGGACISISNFSIRKGGDETFSLNKKFTADIKPVQQELSDFYLSNYYAKPMDKTLNESYDEKLWIAKITLIRQNSAVIIDKVSPAPFSQYRYNPQQLMTLRRLKAFYPSVRQPLAVQAPQAANNVSAPSSGQDMLRNTACGVFTMSLGLGYDIKEPIFSEEIMHGLGMGPVYVDVGVEYITENKKKGSTSEIFLGDISIFDNNTHANDSERIYKLSTAVKILPERGTFIVGIRLGDTSGPISLRVRWYAIRLGEINKKLKQSQNGGERMMLVNPDTIVIQPKATAHITPVFVNMPTEACTYKLMDTESGTIDQNGLYTAPSREGVYEIRIEAISDATVYCHAFAIVTQKKKA